MRSLFITGFAFSLLIANSPTMGNKPTVIVSEVEQRDIVIELEAIGSTEAYKVAQVRNRIEGYLQNINYNDGGFAKKGETLFSIDPSLLKTTVEQMEANVEQSEANYKNSVRNFNRIKSLFEENASSKQDYDNSLFQKELTQALVKMAKATLANSKLNLTYTSINAPISGLADKSNIQIGGYVPPSTILTTIYQIDPIYATFSLTEMQYLSLPNNILDKNVSIILSNGNKFDGKIEFKSPIFDGGGLMLKARVDNREFILRPGQFIKAKIYMELKNSIVVPQKALMQGHMGRFVYTIKDSKTVPRVVEIGEWVGENVVIKKGLNVGEIIVIEGRAMPNMEVKPIKKGE